jgi:hypothetical protein
MRWLALYVRSRQVVVGMAVAAASVTGFGLVAGDGEQTRLLLAMFAVTVVCAVTATGLAGPDIALERTSARDWRLRRATHVVAIGGLAVVLGVTTGPPVATELLVRDAIGLTGLAALATTVVGSGLAWCLPVTWSAAATTALLASRPTPAPLLTWPVQPPGTTAATAAAYTLGVAGLLAYSLLGPSTTSRP